MMTVVATVVQGFEEKYAFYRNIFLYCGIAALVFLAIAIILFFALRIPQVFGELTGRTARKDGGVDFVVIRSLVEIHTDEVIGI